MSIKTIVFVSVCFINAETVHADYDIGNLDKLFTNKQQRAQMDVERTEKNSDKSLPQVSTINISGYVSRSNGESVVWVNDKNTLNNSRLGHIKVYHSSVGVNKKVTVSVDGQMKSLRPGEIWNKETDRVIDSQ